MTNAPLAWILGLLDRRKPAAPDPEWYKDLPAYNPPPPYCPPPNMNEPPKVEIAVGAKVRVKMARDLEGKVHRVGLSSATIQVDSDHGPLILCAPFEAIEPL